MRPGQQTSSVARTARPRAGKLADDPLLRGYIEDKLARRWSPQQIAERLCLDFPADRGMRLSHETIYTSLFVQAKAVLPGELTANTRCERRPLRFMAAHGAALFGRRCPGTAHR